MLVLTRKQGESLRIGDNVTIKILEIRGRGLKIGIEAPQGIRILRGELEAHVEPSRPARRRRIDSVAVAV